MPTINTHTSLYWQSEGEPPELEELNDEYEDGWDILDKAKPLEQPTSGNPSFITEGSPPPEDDNEGKQMSPTPAPDTSGTGEEIPLITTRNKASDSCEGGLFSTRSTASPPAPSSLIMGAPPSPPPNRRVGFKPVIEVVNSSDSARKMNNEKHSQPIIDPTRTPDQPTIIPESTRSTTKKSSVSSSRDSSKLAWSSVTGKTPAAPESTELEIGGQWAVNASTANKTEPLKTKPGSKMESEGLLIEEIDDDDDDFNVGRLPLTADEKAVIAQTDAALQGIKNRPISELSEEERVWHLAASAGSTSLEGGAEGAELDEETKVRVRERLSKHGLIDKTSLKF